MATPRGGVHRCPDCGARYAERRTPRSRAEKLLVALTGRRPYRCLQCDRRFYDRPAHLVGSGPEATAPPPATTAHPAARRRQAYWRVDIGDAGVRPGERYLLAFVVLVVAALAAGLVLLLWPEAVGVVHRGD